LDEKIPGCPPDIKLFKKVLEKLKKEKIVSKIKKVTPPDFTAKIEGHGTLKINFKEKKVKFEAEESERLVEGLVLNKNFQLAPFITSRICGICPIAHNICSISAIEDALKIKPKPEVIILRKILLASQIIKSHLLHLFFLVLPDYGKVRGTIELSKKYPAEFHLMLNIKRIADKILKIIGGSQAFPNNTKIAGFKRPIKKEELLEIREEIFDVFDEAEDLIKLFSSFQTPKISVQTTFLAISSKEPEYPFYPGNLSLKIKEIVEKENPAKLGVLRRGEIAKVGALARLSHHSKYLNPKAKKIFKKTKIDFQNPFHNNLAQAIEILHFLEETVNLIEKIKNENLENLATQENIKIKKPSQGKAVLEAPRGILIHQLKIDSRGKIKDYNIIPPTQINLVSLEKEANELIKTMSRKPVEKQKREIEKLIRAFDPCITCAVH
jgi:coenzyme F420-reducing hydrogenase alpha subunit